MNPGIDFAQRKFPRTKICLRGSIDAFCKITFMVYFNLCMLLLRTSDKAISSEHVMASIQNKICASTQPKMSRQVSVRVNKDSCCPLVSRSSVIANQFLSKNQAAICRGIRSVGPNRALVKSFGK